MANVGTGSIRLVDSDGDAMDSGGALQVKLVDSASINIGDVDVLSIAAGDNNIGNVDIASIAAGDNNIGNVDIASSVTLSVNSHEVTNAGTFVIQEDGDALTALQLIDDAIYADDADFTLDSSKGIAIMGYYGTNQQMITDGDIGVISVDERGQVKTVTNLGEIDTFAMLDIDNAAELLSDTIGVLSDCIEMFFQADESNSGYVIIGDIDVADNRGMKLNPGDTLILNIVDTRGIHLWGSAANQNVRCMITRSAL